MTQKEVREQLELCEKERESTEKWCTKAGWELSELSIVNYPALLKQLDEAMRFLKEGHDRFHGHLGEHDNCLVRDHVRAYFGETR